MFVKSIVSGAIMASAAMGHAIRQTGPQRFACGAPEPTDSELSIAYQMADEEAAGNSTLAARATIQVETYMHVVSSSTSASDGYLSDATLQAQLAVINSDFAASGVQFVLAGTTRTVNSNWANDKSELTMKRALRKGGYDALNLYFMTYVSGYLGYCYFPTSTSTGSTTFYKDGCSILAESAPGASSGPFNLGKTATHEIGHWFGLYHTFQGGCFGGDSVSDTPAQSSASSGCPKGRDSCPTLAGLDPVTNYMDYSDDACYEEFTAGQAARISSMWNSFRA